MPGYHLIEERVLKPNNPDGIEPHPNRKGFLDYLRELRQDDFPFQRGYKLAVVGLEDVLLAAGNQLPEVEDYIHRALSSSSKRVELNEHQCPGNISG